jgi:hypothetical protein
MLEIFSFDSNRIHNLINKANDNAVPSKTFKVHGRTVNWVDGRHYEKQELEKYRLVGDVELDNILDLIANSSKEDDVTFTNVIQQCANVYHRIEACMKQGETRIQDMKLSEAESAMYHFYQHYHDNLPEIDFDQIQRGIDVFIQYSFVAGLSLYYLALVPGFGIPKIAKVLEYTRYLAPPSTSEQVKTRLLDTGGFISTVMLPDGKSQLSASSLRPGSKGWTMALQVRTLHAKVRRKIKTKSSWDIQEFGIPINQEDMGATLLAFSVNVIAGIEYITAKPMDEQEQLDYLALWRYIGWLLGVETVESKNCDPKYQNASRSNLTPMDPCGTRPNGHRSDSPIVHSRSTLESIIIHLMEPNDSSKKIVKHLLSVGQPATETSPSNVTSMRSKTSNSSVMYLYRCYMCRLHVGDNLADALDIPQINYFSWRSLMAVTLSRTILSIFRAMFLVMMVSSPIKKRMFQYQFNMMGKFFKFWTSSHGKRMDKAAKKAMKSKQSMCPFSVAWTDDSAAHSKLD